MLMGTRAGLKQWYQTVSSNSGIKQWHQTVVSNSGIKQWYQTVVSNSGIRQWYQTVVSNSSGANQIWSHGREENWKIFYIFGLQDAQNIILQTVKSRGWPLWLGSMLFFLCGRTSILNKIVVWECFTCMKVRHTDRRTEVNNSIMAVVSNFLIFVGKEI